MITNNISLLASPPATEESAIELDIIEPKENVNKVERNEPLLVSSHDTEESNIELDVMGSEENVNKVEQSGSKNVTATESVSKINVALTPEQVNSKVTTAALT